MIRLSLALLLGISPVLLAAEAPINVGSRRSLFVDDYLIERLSGEAELTLHHPVPREVVFTADRPWEGNLMFHITVFRDGDIYRMYYRGWDYGEDKERHSQDKFICYAESKNGLDWTRPELGLVEFQGSKKNNIILTCKGGVVGNGAFAVFRDDNPKCDPKARYKALAMHSKNGRGLHAFGSPDGIHWSLIHDQPCITRGAFDSHNLGFWDEYTGEYRAYWRYFDEGVRAIRTATSSDFLEWSEGKDLKYGDAPPEHLYTNSVCRYYRAPHLLVGFPKRLVPGRESPTGFHRAGVSDGVFMSSRDGVNFHRWTEAFIRPGLQPDRWVNRNNFTAWGLIETPSSLKGAPPEISLFSTEGYYRGPATRLRRYTLRQDGFVSVQGSYEGGQLTTKPLVFEGDHLEINFSTSAAGTVHVELQSADGTPVPGYTLSDCDPQFGDELSRTVTWKGESDVSTLAGTPVRLRFSLKDADIYSLRFTNAK